MRVQFECNIDQPVIIKATSRTGTVLSLTIDEKRVQSAQVKFVDDAGRVVIDWFRERDLTPIVAKAA